MKCLIDYRDLLNDLFVPKNDESINNTWNFLNRCKNIKVCISKRGIDHLYADIFHWKGKKNADLIIHQITQTLQVLPPASESTIACAMSYSRISQILFDLSLEVSIAIENSVDFILTRHPYYFQPLIPQSITVDSWLSHHYHPCSSMQSSVIEVVSGGLEDLQRLAEFTSSSLQSSNYQENHTNTQRYDLVMAEKIEPIPDLFKNNLRIKDTNLEQWSQKNISVDGWKTLKGLNLENIVSPAFATRGQLKYSSLCRGKILDLETRNQSYQVILLINRHCEKLEDFNIFDINVGLFSKDLNSCLPGMLQLQIINELGKIILEARRPQDELLESCQINFSGERYERFSIKIMLENSVHIENFVI